jgi:putative SOS response-associated peptidase YedK
MCYQISANFTHIDVTQVKEFAVNQVLTQFQPKNSVFPKSYVPVIIPGSRILTQFRWGLIPHWAKDIKLGDKLANARAESIDEKPSFKHSFQNKRCLVLASGFYEWDKNKIQHFIQIPSQKIFAFAGLWDTWINPNEKDKNKQEIKSCTIITTQPNELVGKIHNRMPVILKQEDYETWLTSTDLNKLKSLLAPYLGEMNEKPLEKITKTKTTPKPSKKPQKKDFQKKLM